VRKTRIFVYGEDFDSFIDLLRHAAVWIKQHPVSDEFKQKRRQFWQKRQRGASDRASPARGEPAATTGASATNRQPRPASARQGQPPAPGRPVLPTRAVPPTPSPAAVSAIVSGNPRLSASVPRTSAGSVTRPTASMSTSTTPSAPARRVASVSGAPAGSTARGSAARFAASKPARASVGAGSSR
jgi:hypothetical protein